jgi:hypothetical protein
MDRELSSSYPTSKVEHLSNGAGSLSFNTMRRRSSLHPAEERSARDPRDEAIIPAASREVINGPPQFPAVDFDGLSWPSESL